MKEIGAYDAKTHLGEILDEVAAGQTVIITKRGKPVAKVMPYQSSNETFEMVREQIEAFRSEVAPDSQSIRDMIDEGKRF